MRVAPRFPGGTVFVVIALAAALLLLATMRGSQPVNDTPRNQLQQEDGQQRPNNEFLDRNTNQARSDHNNRGNNLNNNKQPTQDAADRTPKDSGGKMMNRNKKTRPRLVVHLFAYNRPSGFRTLWSQLIRAKPASRLPVRIVIHVDYDPLQSDEWKEQVDIASALTGVHTIHGPVTTVFAASPKGLRATMLEAWAPVEGEYAMFLEDDIEVSEMLFVYAEAFVQRYGESAERDASVMGYKLYNQKWDEVNQRYERPINNGHMPFKIQEPCSWGTVFVAEPYARYLRWYVDHSNIDPFIPHAWSNTWDAERSAKKYLQRFMWEEGLFLISINLPNHLSLTTPHVEAGTNIKQKWLPYLKERLEVPLLTSKDNLLLDQWPDSSDLLMISWDRNILESVVLPSEQLLARFTNTLPAAEDFDPPSLHARDRYLEKTRQRVRDIVYDIDIGCDRAWTSGEVFALTEMLQSLKVDAGEAADGHILCLLARMHEPTLGRPALVVDVKYGLGSRLRAISSALALASGLARTLVVVWRPDNHCGAKFKELFAANDEISVIEDDAVLKALIKNEPKEWQQFDMFNPRVRRDALILDPKKHALIVTAFALNNAPLWHYRNDNMFLRGLMRMPSPAVRSMIDQYYASLPVSIDEAPMFHSKLVGVHIRMNTDVHGEVSDLEQAEQNLDLAVPFRLSCHWQHFAKKLAAYEHHISDVFVASDTHEAASGISQTIDVHTLPLCVSRNTTCMQIATANAMLLSKCTKLYLSKWSAFSELAARAGSHVFNYACDEPEGGWNFSGANQPTLSKQVQAYLTAHGWHDVDQILAAFDRM
eukprot:m.249366 g.249366  ORF g.249366 m.249366 type:complete len:820 (+) comp17165_c1_seq11:528-2987(+)